MSASVIVADRARPVPVLALALLGLVGAFILAGPLLVAADPLAQNLMDALAGPSATHPLGTDHLGRDILARLAHGGARSIGLALACVVGASAIGILLGLVAASFGRWRDMLVMRLADLMLAFPGMLLILVLAGFLGGGLVPILVGLLATQWPAFARMARAVAAGTLREPHVEAAMLAGFPRRTILLRHVLPPVLRATMPLATLTLGSAVLSIASLGFLGLGLQPPTPEWGAMINELLPYLAEAPTQMAGPCAAIFLSVLGMTLLGRHLADAATTTRSHR